MSKKVANIFFMTILMLSWFLLLFSLPLNRDLISRFRNYKSNDLSKPENDELGGTLLDAIAPSPASNSKLFDIPDKEPTLNIAPPVDLNKIVNEVNQPAPKKNTTNTTPPENPQPNPTLPIDNIGTQAPQKNQTQPPEQNQTQPPQQNQTQPPQQNQPQQVQQNQTQPSQQNQTQPPQQNQTQPIQQNQTAPIILNNNTEIKIQPQTINNTNSSDVNNIIINNSTENNTQNTSTSTTLPIKKASNNLLKREAATPVVVPPPPTPPKIVQVPVPVVVYSNQTCNLTMSSNIHTPYPMPETYNMRYMSLIAILIFGSAFLSIRFILSLFKRGMGESTFFIKGIKILANQTIIYFICLSIFNIIYTFGCFDNVPINFEYLIAALFIFGISWVIFCLIILFFCILVSMKWKELETNAKDDFRSIKIRYDNLANKRFDSDANNQNIDTSFFFELYEYLTLKIYFCIPFFPIFKASTLRREFKFYIYLSNCLLQKLRLFFKVSWTCWVVTIFVICVWSVFIAPESLIFVIIFMCLIPITGLVLSILLFYYMKHIYRKVISEINGDNYMSYLDIKHFNQNFACGEFTSFPVYLDNAMANPKETKVTKINFHDHFHHRTPSLYENQIVFGATGFSLLINILQAVGFLFIAWTVLLFVKYCGEIINEYGYVSLVFILILFLIYVFGYSYLLSISLKWYTIISSIEMKRNDECIKKTINYLNKRTAEISNSIFLSFKRLYFDMRINIKEKAGNELGRKNNNFNSLGKQIFKSLIDINITRFKKIHNDGNEIPAKNLDDYPINVNTELRAFLKSCGNRLEEKDVEFMLHLIENFESINSSQITRKQLYDIWGAIMHFSTLTPDEIINYVFDQYFYGRNDIENVERRDSKEMDLEKIEAFLDYFNEYFSREQVQFIKEESSYLGETFSRDAFNYMLLSPRRYHPN